ncbi:MAG: mycothiol synthase [Actinomycetota bacterium]|nr:mycothiol synthase [Actinomycetota bacterium]
MSTLPKGYAVRSATQEDLPEVVRLFDALDATFGLAPATDLELLRGLFRLPSFDADRNTWLITASDGAIAAYGDIEERAEESAIATFGRVHPDHRGKGLGAVLLGLMEQRALEIAGGRQVRIRAVTISQDEAGIALLESSGYHHVRTYWHMERSLEELHAAHLPPGVVIRSFREGDAEVFHRIDTEAFRGQWGMSAHPFDEWKERHLEGEAFEPDMWLLAQLEGEDVGILVGRAWTREAWVDSLAVLGEFRGRGIGAALLQQAFQVFRDAGFRQVALNVDSSNPTGATRLYEAQGMRVRRQWMVYDKELGAR